MLYICYSHFGFFIYLFLYTWRKKVKCNSTDVFMFCLSPAFLQFVYFLFYIYISTLSLSSDRLIECQVSLLSFI